MITICEETLKQLLKSAYANGYDNAQNQHHMVNDLNYSKIREQLYETSMTNMNIPIIISRIKSGKSPRI